MGRKYSFNFQSVAKIEAVTGYVYTREEKEEVKKIASTNHFHVYTVSYTDHGLVLHNMDPDFNKCPFLFVSDNLIENAVFYFVTKTNVETTFGMDIDGDTLNMIPRLEHFEKDGFLQELGETCKRIINGKTETSNET